MGKKPITFVILATLALVFTAYILTPQDNSTDDEVITEYFLGGDRLILRNIDELSLISTDVIRAEILDSRVECINISLSKYPDSDYFMIHTIYRLRISEVYAGNAKIGDIVEIMQMGGRLGDRQLIYDHQLPLSAGDDLVFFLRNFEKEGFGHLPMALVGGGQAVYRVPSANAQNADIFAGRIVEALSVNQSLANFTFERVDPENHLTLTIGDLIQIKDAADREAETADLEIEAIDPEADAADPETDAIDLETDAEIPEDDRYDNTAINEGKLVNALVTELIDINAFNLWLQTIPPDETSLVRLLYDFDITQAQLQQLVDDRNLNAICNVSEIMAEVVAYGHRVSAEEQAEQTDREE